MVGPGDPAATRCPRRPRKCIHAGGRLGGARRKVPSGLGARLCPAALPASAHAPAATSEARDKISRGGGNTETRAPSSKLPRVVAMVNCVPEAETGSGTAPRAAILEAEAAAALRRVLWARSRRGAALRRGPFSSAPCSGLDHGEPERGGGPPAATGRDEQQQQQESPNDSNPETEAGLPSDQERPGALHLRRAPPFQYS